VTQPKHEKTVKLEIIQLQYQKCLTNSSWQQLFC